MSRTVEQERLRKRRQRERRKAGEWYALVDIESAIIRVLVLHGLLSEVHNPGAVKRAIALLVDRYAAARGGIYLEYPANMEGWHYHDPMGQSALSPARKKRLQRRRWEDGWLRLQLRVDDKLLAALVADGFLDENQKADRAEVAETLQRTLWALANCGAVLMPLDRYGLYNDS